MRRSRTDEPSTSEDLAAGNPTLPPEDETPTSEETAAGGAQLSGDVEMPEAGTSDPQPPPQDQPLSVAPRPSPSSVPEPSPSPVPGPSHSPVSEPSPSSVPKPSPSSVPKPSSSPVPGTSPSAGPRPSASPVPGLSSSPIPGSSSSPVPGPSSSPVPGPSSSPVPGPSSSPVPGPSSSAMRHPAPLPAPRLPRVGPPASPLVPRLGMNGTHNGTSHTSSSSDAASSRRPSRNSNTSSLGAASSRAGSSLMGVSSLDEMGNGTASSERARTSSSSDAEAPANPPAGGAVQGSLPSSGPSSLSAPSPPPPLLSPGVNLAVMYSGWMSREQTTSSALRPSSETSSRTSSSHRSSPVETSPMPTRQGSSSASAAVGKVSRSLGTPSRATSSALRPLSGTSSQSSSSHRSSPVETSSSRDDPSSSSVHSRSSSETDPQSVVRTRPRSPSTLGEQQGADTSRSSSKRSTETSDPSVPEKKGRLSSPSTSRRAFAGAREESEEPIAGPSRQVPPPSYAEATSTPPHLSPILPRSSTRKSSKLKRLFLRLKSPTVLGKLKKEATDPGPSGERSKQSKLKITPKFLADALTRVVEALRTAPNSSSLSPEQQTLEVRQRESDGAYVVVTSPKAAQTGSRLRGLFSSIRHPGRREASDRDRSEEAPSTSGGDQSGTRSLRAPLRRQDAEEDSASVISDSDALPEESGHEVPLEEMSPFWFGAVVEEPILMSDLLEMGLQTAEGEIVIIDVSLYPSSSASLATQEEMLSDSDEEPSAVYPLAEDESTLATSQPSGEVGDSLSTSTFATTDVDDENSLCSADTNLATSTAKLNVESETGSQQDLSVGSNVPTPMEMVSEENAGRSGNVTSTTPRSETVSAEITHSAVASELATPTDEPENKPDEDETDGSSKKDETKPESP